MEENKIFLFLVFICFLYHFYNSHVNKTKITDKRIIKYFSPNYSQTKIKPIKDGKIFISIASYRDPLLKQTVESLIEKCQDVSQIRIVICEQNSKDDVDFIYSPFSMTKIEIIKIPHTEARGPCWARYLIQQKFEGEEFYLQIDSHTKFICENWDTKLKDMISILPEKTCLSNYVASFDHATGEINNKPLRGPMKIVNYNKQDKFMRFNSKYVNYMDTPEKSFGWSGCFSFSSSQIIVDAPYDPYVPFLFFGEETDIYLRLLSKKWSMYVPNIPICATVFDRSYRKTFWEHPDKDIVTYSRQRLYHRFNWIKINDPLILKNNYLYSINSKVK